MSSSTTRMAVHHAQNLAWLHSSHPRYLQHFSCPKIVVQWKESYMHPHRSRHTRNEKLKTFIWHGSCTTMQHTTRVLHALSILGKVVVLTLKSCIAELATEVSILLAGECYLSIIRVMGCSAVAQVHSVDLPLSYT